MTTVAAGQAEQSTTAPSLRFPRRLRLLKPAEFQQVFKQAVRIGGPALTLLVRANGLEHPRLGLAISRKHARRAIDRARIKRQIRESFRHHQYVLGGVDIIALSRAGITELSPLELRRSVDGRWTRVVERCERSSLP